MRYFRKSGIRLIAFLALPAALSCKGGTEPEPVATVEISPATLTVEPGGSGQLTATARSAAGTELPGRQFSWTVAGPSIATVSQTGTVTGITDGTTTVSATAGGKTANATVNVRTPVANVVVSPPNGSISVGGSGLQLSASVRSATGALLTERVVTWTTSNPGIATVSTTGNVVGVSAGDVTITATAEGRSGSAAITVEDPCAASRPILVGQTLSGTLSAVDCRLDDQTVLQAFRLVLNSAASLEIQMVSSVVDPYLFVTDAQGNVLAEDDDGGAVGVNARVLGNFSPGTYFILANTFAVNSYGPYQLTVAQAPLPCINARLLALPSGVPNVLSSSTSCRLNDDRWFDAYAFSIGQVATVRFDLTSSVIDPAIILIDGEGNIVAQDDDAGSGTNARIEGQLAVGQYFAFVTAKPNQLGAYRLDVTPVIDPCGVTRFINPAQTQNGTITASDCAVTISGPIPFTQRWGMTVATPQALQIDMSSSIVDAYLILQDFATGDILAENDDVSPTSTNSRITGFFPAGQYIINASTFSFGETGAYTLSVTPVTTTQPVSVTVAPNNVSLSPGQTQQLTATVTGNANTAVTWETSAGGIATVSTTGVVRGVTPGSATITARSVVDPSKSALVTVTVGQSTGAPNLDIAAMYLVQSVQQLNGSVRLVANRDAVARVFVRGSRTGITGVTVRVRVMQGATVLETFQGNVTPSLTVDESCCSANFLIPATHIRTGVSIIADVDPSNAIAEVNETDNSFPINGTPQPLNVTTVPDLNIRLVPIRQNRSGLVGSPSATLGNMVRSLWPVATVNITTRATLGLDFALPAEDFNEWFRMVQELELVRRAESSNIYYYGVVRVNYTNGVTGMAGGIPAMTAVGVDESFGAEFTRFNFAHELGHAMGLRHAPCGGAAGPDPAFPFQGGLTGSYGLDVAGGLALKRPNFTDIMGYCENKWVSAYNYNIVMDQRARFPNGVPAGSISPNVSPVLLITGRVTSGQATVDGSFALEAQASIEDPAGRFVLEGFDASGRSVFSHRFSPFTVHDARPGDEAFVVGIPLDTLAVASIARVEVRELNGVRRQVRVRADAATMGSAVSVDRLATGLRLTTGGAAGMVLVRHPQTREVLAVTRGGAVNLADFAGVPEVELLVSDGVASIRQRVNTATGAIIR